MPPLRLLVVLTAFLLAALPATAQERRVALVVGNTAYSHAPALANAVNDAEAMAATLRGLGFTVMLERNQTASAMRRTLRDFSDAARGADVALFFFAGHGMQMASATVQRVIWCRWMHGWWMRGIRRTRPSPCRAYCS